MLIWGWIFIFFVAAVITELIEKISPSIYERAMRAMNKTVPEIIPIGRILLWTGVMFVICLPVLSADIRLMSTRWILWLWHVGIWTGIFLILLGIYRIKEAKRWAASKDWRDKI